LVEHTTSASVAVIVNSSCVVAVDVMVIVCAGARTVLLTETVWIGVTTEVTAGIGYFEEQKVCASFSVETLVTNRP
jgi:hypothetical protein